MIGAADIGNCMSESGEFDDLAGITPRAISELFRLLNERTAQIDYTVIVINNIFFYLRKTTTMIPKTKILYLLFHLNNISIICINIYHI